MKIVDQRKIFFSLKTHPQRMPRNEGENGMSCRSHQLLSLYCKILHALKQSFGNRRLESAEPHSLVCSGQSLLLPPIFSYSNPLIHSVTVCPQKLAAVWTLSYMVSCKEIQPVHPEGNQSWISFGRTDAEAETPILWPPDANSWLIRKDSDAGKDWGQEEKGTTEDEIVGWHHQLDGHEFE